MNSLNCQAELEGALYSTDYGIEPLILSLIVNYNKRNALKLIPRLYFHYYYSFDFEESLSEADGQKILEQLKRLTLKNN